ncbi:SDR family oxidoreductase [Candidatus Peregrinibacteria bacterium]|nr:SDR family oxidoreductase [Candidatus Peregrinibacteria bacterium]MBI3816971.1 SDR family oxidoreductase [Candidatus Peregrinibacteria bacterium]
MRPNLPSLSDKKAIVTGAAKGIGKGTARLFAELGAHVLLVDKDEREGQNTTSTIQDEGGSAEFLQCNLGVKEDIDRVMAHVRGHFGQIDILVNNAFFWNFKPFREQTWDDLDSFAKVNMVGTTYLTQQVIEGMRGHVRGSIIFISSVHEETVRRLHPPYSMGKAGIKMLVRELAVEYGPHGIRVNAIAPGHVEVEQEERADNPYIPLGGKSALPEDIAKMAVLLASEEITEHVTGVSIPVDGGERLYGEWTDRLKPGG